MNKALALSALVALSAGLASCGGGGSATPPISQGIAPTSAPTTAPTSTPTSTPTVAPSLKVIGGAPISATASQLSRVRSQAKTQAQGVTNGIPILVESSGSFAINAGTFVNWVTNAANGQDVPQTSGTITTTNNLLVNNPGFSQACVGSIAAACVVHPTAWEYGTDSGQIKPLGKQTLTIVFGDGTTAQTNDFVYNGWGLHCNEGWAYVGGSLVVQATRATSDVYADCVAGNIVFTQGAVIMATPSQDQYGRNETVFPTLTAAFILNSLFTNAPMPSIAQGEVFGIITRDGGFSKVYFTSGAGSTTVISSEGMALHANPDGSYPY